MPAHPEGSLSLVVCESMFGNTRAIADTVADSLAAQFDRVDVVDVDDAPHSLTGVNLLVVGAPTHALGLSRPSTRQAAHKEGAPAPAERGVREWLGTLERPAEPICAAVFDTQVRKPFLSGSAARAMRRRLRRRGFRVLAPMSFAVGGTPGLLVDGELDRARQWAASLEAMARPAVSRS